MNDRCAECFEPLVETLFGGRYACTKCPTTDYWSEAVPEHGKLADIRLVSKHGRPTLYFYRGYP